MTVTGEPYVEPDWAVVAGDDVDGVCDDGVSVEGVCDEGVCGEDGDGVCANATLAESTRPLVHRPDLIIREIDIDPPTDVITWLPDRPQHSRTRRR